MLPSCWLTDKRHIILPAYPTCQLCGSTQLIGGGRSRPGKAGAGRKPCSTASGTTGTPRTFDIVLGLDLCYAATSSLKDSCSFVLPASATSQVFRMTYSTGIKMRFSTVENNIPPTIAVPTECRPSLPAPLAK